MDFMDMIAPQEDKTICDDDSKKYKVNDKNCFHKILGDKNCNNKIFGDNDRDGILNSFDRKPNKKSKMFDIRKLI